MVAAKMQYNNGYRLPSPIRKTEKRKKEHSQFVYSLIYHRTEILIGIIGFIVIMSMIFAAYCAKTWEDFGGTETSPKVGNILGLLVDYGGWIDQILGASKATEYAGLLSITGSGTSFTIGGVPSLTGLSAVLTTVNNLFKIIGWGLALIFWGYSFAEMMMQSNGQLIVEQVIKKLLFLVVCYYVIDNSLTLCCEVVNAGTELTNAALGGINAVTVDGAAAFKEEVFNACWTEEGKIGGIADFSGIITNINAIGYVIQLFIPWIITLICDLIIRVLCWSRAIEICILAAISPIMFMDLGSARELTHSSTARALKNLMSLAMQGALILISLSICQSIMSGVLSDTALTFSDKVWKISLVAILQVGTIAKTQNVAKQALGI